MNNVVVYSGMKINNVPDSAKEYKYWVVSEDNDDLWFYGAYEDNNSNDCVEALTPDFRRLIINPEF
jgi:hypothetical protein